MRKFNQDRKKDYKYVLHQINKKTRWGKSFHRHIYASQIYRLSKGLLIYTNKSIKISGIVSASIPAIFIKFRRKKSLSFLSETGDTLYLDCQTRLSLNPSTASLTITMAFLRGVLFVHLKKGT
jgi:hypothetical protein